MSTPSPFRIAPGLFDQSEPRTLGLAALPVRDQRIYEATADGWRFSHTANLAVFRERLYLMWSNGKQHEDSAGQRILLATSADGETWSEPRTLLSPEDVVADEPRGALMSAGFVVEAGVLHAYATWAHSARFHDGEVAHLVRIASADGERWTGPTRVAEGTYLEGPRQTGPQDWVLLGQTSAHQPIFQHASARVDHGHWTRCAMPAALPTVWPEPSSYLRPDGSLVATLRVAKEHRCLWGCESRDGGRTWSAPVATDFPSATARTAAGNLPDGTAYLVCNPNADGGDGVHAGHSARRVLAIALSRDGVVFGRAWSLLIDPPNLRFDGRAKMGGWQYPNALVWGDRLYVAYTVSKEDVGVLSVALADLA